MPPVMLARWSDLRRPTLWTATNNRTTLTVNESTLMAVHPLDTRYLLDNDVWFRFSYHREWEYGWDTVDTDFIAVCKKGRLHRSARYWYFYQWNGKRFEWAEWNDLSTDQQLLIIANFCRYFRRNKSWVPWKDDIEETAMVWVALEQA